MRAAHIVSILVGWSFLAAGCQSRPKPPDVSTVRVDFSAYSGSAIGAATTRPIENVQSGWLVRTTLVAIDRDPGQPLHPLSAAGRMFTQDQQGEPIVANPLLTREVRFGRDADADEFVTAIMERRFGEPATLASSGGVLAEGVTLAVAARNGDQVIDLRLHRVAGESFDLLVGLQGAPPVDPTASADAGANPAVPAFVSESVLVSDVPLDVPHPVVLVIPHRIDGSSARAVIAIFEFSLQSADESFDAAARETAAMLERSAAGISGLPTKLPVQSDAWGGYEWALRRSEDPVLRRGSLNYIAGQTGGTIAQDLIVVADDATLGEYTALLLRSMSASNLPHESALLGWLMDRTALEVCVAQSGRSALPRELSSVLTIHAGEAGRNAASLGDLIKDLRNRDDLQTRLTVENLIYLEDTSPGARVRAFDWLTAKGRAPAGYDPLGTVQERRAALERAQAATAAPDAASPQTTTQNGPTP